MIVSNKIIISLIKDWWKRHGNNLLLIMIIFFVIGVSWQYWNRYSNSNLESPSNMYSQLLNYWEQKNIVEFKLFGERLLRDYPKSPYASFAALLLAKDAIQHGDFKEALTKLRFVINKAPNSKIRELAQLRAARVLIAINNPKEALILLSKISNQCYKISGYEISGDALLTLGKFEDAIKIYRKAEQLSKNQELFSPLLKMKLQQL
ncbi:MAG: tetratricopeptide repeat protein [Coxiellaceae bacterium]|jgi:predicted negative regulator of RcsB-dependent stress response|nr:tetratricopeptide repeat protein [Coxiellaceae bacterium]